MLPSLTGLTIDATEAATGVGLESGISKNKKGKSPVRKLPRAKEQDDGNLEDDECVQDATCAKLKLVNQSVTSALTKLFLNTAPSRLGTGRDQSEKTEYNQIVPLAVFEIQYGKDHEQFKAYKFRRNKMVIAQKECNEYHNGDECVRTDKVLGPIAEKLNGGALGSLHSAVNEKFLLHGSKIGPLLSIIRTKFRVDMSKIGRQAFGSGVYQAEDAGKADQYANSSGYQEINMQLGVESWGDTYYMLVTRTVLGCATHMSHSQIRITHDSKKDMKGKGFVKDMDDGGNETFRFPDNYDSLIKEHADVLRGGFMTGNNYREFLVQNADQIIPVMIVAYRRVENPTVPAFDHRVLECARWPAILQRLQFPPFKSNPSIVGEEYADAKDALEAVLESAETDYAALINAGAVERLMPLFEQLLDVRGSSRPVPRPAERVGSSKRTVWDRELRDNRYMPATQEYTIVNKVLKSLVYIAEGARGNAAFVKKFREAGGFHVLARTLYHAFFSYARLVDEDGHRMPLLETDAVLKKRKQLATWAGTDLKSLLGLLESVTHEATRVVAREVFEKVGYPLLVQIGMEQAVAPEPESTELETYHSRFRLGSLLSAIDECVRTDRKATSGAFLDAGGLAFLTAVLTRPYSGTPEYEYRNFAGDKVNHLHHQMFNKATALDILLNIQQHQALEATYTNQILLQRALVDDPLTSPFLMHVMAEGLSFDASNSVDFVAEFQRRRNSRLAFQVLEHLCMKNEPISHSVLEMLHKHMQDLSDQPQTANAVTRIKELAGDGLLIVPTNVLVSFTNNAFKNGLSMHWIGVSMQNWTDCAEIALRILSLALIDEGWDTAPIALLTSVKWASTLDQNSNAMAVLDAESATHIAQLARGLLLQWSELDAQPMEQ